MKASGGLTQNKIVIGNSYNKYAAKNPLIKLLMNGFLCTLDELIAKTNPLNIHEVGCGEGFLALRWRKQGLDVRGSDFSEKIIEIARDNAVSQGVEPEIFKVRSFYDLSPEADSAELLVCCEVLEHLEDPVAALEVLKSLAPKYVLLSVPQEPLWRILNVMRGKYLGEWGNTPGHIQHWSRKELITFLQPFFSIVEVRSPLPWTIVLCRTKNAAA